MDNRVIGSVTSTERRPLSVGRVTKAGGGSPVAAALQAAPAAAGGLHPPAQGRPHPPGPAAPAGPRPGSPAAGAHAAIGPVVTPSTQQPHKSSALNSQMQLSASSQAAPATIQVASLTADNSLATAPLIMTEIETPPAPPLHLLNKTEARPYPTLAEYDEMPAPATIQLIPASLTADKSARAVPRRASEETMAIAMPETAMLATTPLITPELETTRFAGEKAGWVASEDFAAALAAVRRDLDEHCRRQEATISGLAQQCEQYRHSALSMEENLKELQQNMGAREESLMQQTEEQGHLIRTLQAEVTGLRTELVSTREQLVSVSQEQQQCVDSDRDSQVADLQTDVGNLQQQLRSHETVLEEHQAKQEENHATLRADVDALGKQVLAQQQEQQAQQARALRLQVESLQQQLALAQAQAPADMAA